MVWGLPPPGFLCQLRCIISQHDVEDARKRLQGLAAVHADARQLIGSLRILNGAVKGERIEGRANVAVGQQIRQHQLSFIRAVMVKWLAGRVAEELDWLNQL